MNLGTIHCFQCAISFEWRANIYNRVTCPNCRFKVRITEVRTKPIRGWTGMTVAVDTPIVRAAWPRIQTRKAALS